MRFQEASGIFINSSAKDTQNFFLSIFAFYFIYLFEAKKKEQAGSEEKQKEERNLAKKGKEQGKESREAQVMVMGLNAN